MVEVEIIHVVNDHMALEDAYLKTFLVFFMIGVSSKVYDIRSGSMYSSNFPKFTVELVGVPFEKVEM